MRFEGALEAWKIAIHLEKKPWITLSVYYDQR
jgi:hypothetical protein